jgi:propanol-preferring alcohol dehydrogenase
MPTMRAMVLDRPKTPLVLRERPVPQPAAGQVLIAVEACGVCRTDLHVVDGELPDPKLPVVPGHEIVGRVAALGPDVRNFALGTRVGVPWLGEACGVCPYCRSGRENLCDAPVFTGYTRDGGYATHTLANARFSFALPENLDAAETAPLLCAGLIGWRSYRMAGQGEALGLYGFGARATRGRKTSRGRSARCGPAVPTRCRRKNSMPPSSLRRSARSWRQRLRR